MLRLLDDEYILLIEENNNIVFEGYMDLIVIKGNLNTNNYTIKQDY